MSDTVVKSKKGFSAFQLKIIALVCMTIDHIAAYGGFEVNSTGYVLFRVIGRIAAPLFLFLLVQSIHYTRDKKKFIIRLYSAGALIGIFDTFMNYVLGKHLGYFQPGNILFTFFYVAFYCVLLESIWNSFKEKDYKKVLKKCLILFISFIPSILFRDVSSLIPTYISEQYRVFIKGIINSFFPSFLDYIYVEYGVGFIALGILMYFLKTKIKQCSIFYLFWFIVTTIAILRLSKNIVFPNQVRGFANLYQIAIILALPFMILYNGEKGKGCKWLFYLYYPIHRQIIHFLFLFIN